MRLLLAYAAALAALGGLASGAFAAGPIQTALVDNGELAGPDAQLALARSRAAGATAFRLTLEWYKVAPVERPKGFDAANPLDPAYHWDDFDRKIRMIVSAGLEPIVTLHYPPVWAGGGYRATPDPVEFAKFAHAAAERYDGGHLGLPRVRNWMVYNEPNLEQWFGTQYEGDKLVSPARYRTLLNAAADALHSVHSDNNVIAGALSPFGFWDAATNLRTAPPLDFMRSLLCLGADNQPTCSDKVEFDTWAHHPYTRGSPTHHAEDPHDASFGDLGTMRAILDAAVRAGHVVSSRPPRFWITEFSWDTKPPDPGGVPLWLHARWISEALHDAWKLGISMLAWLELRDYPYPQNQVQAGLWFRGGDRLSCDSPKPGTLESLRFPFVAYRKGKGFDVWGRTPWGRPGRVAVERLTPKGWKRLVTMKTNANGIFNGRVKAKPVGGRFRQQLATPHHYDQAVTCDGPRAYWRFEERSGTTARDERGGPAGTYDSGVRLGTAGALSDDGDRGVTLNGSSRVWLGWQPSPRSVEVWIKTTKPQLAAAFSNRNAKHQNVFVGTAADGHALAFDSHALESPKAVDDGRWHDLVYTYDGSSGRLYVDGKLAAGAAFQRAGGAQTATLGYDTPLNSFFQGSIDDLSLYDFTLTDAQVREHYAARVHRHPGSLSYKGPYLRARLAGGSLASAPFSLTPVPDRHYEPFG